MATIDEDAVRARAYQLWEESGRVHGNHEEHWRRARAECAVAISPGVDGEISRPLVDVRPKPRRWPTPIVDV